VRSEGNSEMKTYSAINRSVGDIFDIGFDLEQTLLLDDTRENSEAAATPGMPVILFESSAQLEGGLAQHGIQAA
jgi:hypothetical protein